MRYSVTHYASITFRMSRRATRFLVLTALVYVPSTVRADVFTIRDKNNSEIKIEANLLGKFRNGDCLIETADTQYRSLVGDSILAHERSQKKIKPYGKSQFRAALLKEYGATFHVHETQRYIVCYSCDSKVAIEASALFERAYTSFVNFFNNKGGFRFQHPPFPLVAIVFNSRADYIEALSDTLGPRAASTAGVYLPRTNRMYMFDHLAGLGGQLARADGVRPPTRLDPRNVMTIVHESVHQVAFNTGFHQRNSEPPVWLLEGMAMFFESSGDNANGNWQGGGQINRLRLEEFRRSWANWNKDSLRALVVDDQRFRSASSAGAAYSEAWAFTYFLARARTASYMKFIKRVNDRPAGQRYTAEDRLADFKLAFGKPPEQLDADFRNYIGPALAAKPQRP